MRMNNGIHGDSKGLRQPLWARQGMTLSVAIGAMLGIAMVAAGAPQSTGSSPKPAKPQTTARAAAKPAVVPPKTAKPKSGASANPPKTRRQAAQKGTVVVPPAPKPATRNAESGPGAGSSSESSAPTVTVLYDEIPGTAGQTAPAGAEFYVGIYQDNADLGARSGVVNPARVVAHARTVLQANPGAKWGMLDFEFPYDEILLHGPSDPRHEAAVKSLVATVRAVRAEFPEVRWTYYGFPRIPYWIGMKDWGMLTEAERSQQFAKAHASFGAILDELDWVQPSLYDKYEDALGMPRSGSPRAVAEAAFRTACVEVVAKWFEGRRPAPPIIPVVSPWFQPGGRATVFRAIPEEEFLREQVQPALAAGAAGISIWGAMNYYLKITTVHPAPTSSYATQWRPIARSAFASEHFGGKSAEQVQWGDARTREVLGGAFHETFMKAVMASQSDAARGVIANGDER